MTGKSEPLTAEERLRDAIAGERRDWHRVEVSSHDIEVVLATLDAARDRPGLDVERLVGALAAVDARIVTEFPEEAAEMESDEAALGRRSYAEAVAAEYAALAEAEQREGAVLGFVDSDPNRPNDQQREGAGE